MSGRGPAATDPRATRSPADPEGRRHRSAVGPLVLAAALLAAAGAMAAVALRGPAAPRSLEERVHTIASTLRCPVCQNLSVADSPSALAREMRATIREGLREGKTAAEIRSEFAAAYGEWVLLSPPRRGFNWVVWATPFLLLTGGVALTVLSVRRWSGRGRLRQPEPEVQRTPPGLAPADRLLLERALSDLPEEPE